MDYREKIIKRIHALLDELFLTLNGAYTKQADYWREDADGFMYLDEELKKEAEYTRDVLRQYVDSWIESGSNFQKWEEKNPKLFKDINRNLRTIRFKLRADFFDPQKAWMGASEPIAPFDRSYRPEQPATWLFLKFITSPVFERVGKCLKCGHYFYIKSGHQKKIYCSRKCATHMTALISTKARRQREHKEKLKRSHKGLVKIGRRVKLPADWKKLVAKKAGVTTRWLTRAINKGELQPPRKSRIALVNGGIGLGS